MTIKARGASLVEMALPRERPLRAATTSVYARNNALS